jgi:hypothetical protein
MMYVLLSFLAATCANLHLYTTRRRRHTPISFIYEIMHREEKEGEKGEEEDEQAGWKRRR